jgi:DNA-binding NtrC family response regulator
MGSKKLILVVDDEHMIEEMMEMQLQRAGYKHASFNDPKQAMEFFVKNHEDLDLAILDLTMPKMTGTDMAKEMCKIEPNLPIILITGTVEGKGIEVTANIQKILYKPIPRDELIDAVSKYLHSG